MQAARRLIAVACTVAIAIGLCAPARAHDLLVPLSGTRARPISVETLFHTLFEDFYDEDDGTTYVQTGDIPAMWLRDSSAQTLPYVRFASIFPSLSARIDMVIQRNAHNVLTDPYANAFQPNYHVWERKWEIDSLASPVLLTWTYWQQTHNAAVFTPVVHDALRTIVTTYACEQQHERCSRYAYPYHVVTRYAYAAGTGMIWSAFRPSDDAVDYRFNIPQQTIAAIALVEIAFLAREGYGDETLAQQAERMAQQVMLGVERYGRVYAPQHGGWVYAYETDGLGRYTFMDDANVPNLIALPNLGWSSANDPDYLTTRSFVLSKNNPYYYTGRYAQGLGSPHTPFRFIWPLGIIMRALTATSAAETSESITALTETNGMTGNVHESFYADGYWRFTRSEFGWGNAIYAELLFRSIAGFPGPHYVPYGTMLPYERVSSTPTLTRPMMQIENTGLLVETLAYLLELSGGRSQIPNFSALR